MATTSTIPSTTNANDRPTAAATAATGDDDDDGDNNNRKTVAEQGAAEKQGDSESAATTTTGGGGGGGGEAIVLSRNGTPIDRVVKSVPHPPSHRLESDQLWNSETGLPNIEVLQKFFALEGRLREDDAIRIVLTAKDILKKEPNILRIQDPVNVCGDVHGQYFDLLKLFEVGGDYEQTQYLFLGDYVDRGNYSCEVSLLLLSMKICRPNSFFMLRGNHECRHLSAYFNFKQECKFKYSLAFYDAIMFAFDALPLAAILNGRFFCVHGGLSPDADSIEDIENIFRFREPPQSGLMCDLLWSDPMDDEEDVKFPDAEFLHNDLRGCSYVFSFNAVASFLRANNLLCLIRAHEAQDEGYRLYKKNPATNFPAVVCIFSAPNYCDVYNNKGAIIRFQNNLMNIRQFNFSSHPYFLPGFMDVFDWSLPFVAEKVTEMLLAVLNLSETNLESSDDSDEDSPLDQDRAKVIRTKIRTVGKLSRMYKTLREENDTILALKGLVGGQVPQGLLSEGPDALREALGNFQRAKKLDSLNEKRPPFSDEELANIESKEVEQTQEGQEGEQTTPKQD